MRNRELLEELAQRYGVASSYMSQAGYEVTVSEETVVYTLRALGVEISEDPDAQELTGLLYGEYLARASRPLPSCVVAPQGEERSFPVHVHDGDPAEVHIELEGGGTREVYQDPNDAPAADVAGQAWGEASFHLPGDLPLGYHRIILHSPGCAPAPAGLSCPLIITPSRLNTADPYVETPASGVMAQLYSLRSESSWGIGDVPDLGQVAAKLAKDGAYWLINPLH
ncbi:MAG: 4-alpha-glucanotransferase, partial [Corynebacterium flavescens]|nr:4-alpha-glucanotransferase [Corynebacterium flavescens]